MDEQQQEAARRNRERMPEIARLVDRLRSMFGPVAVRYAREGEVEVGRRVETDPARTMTGSEWLHWVKTGEVPAGKQCPWEPPCT